MKYLVFSDGVASGDGGGDPGGGEGDPEGLFACDPPQIVDEGQKLKITTHAPPEIGLTVLVGIEEPPDEDDHDWAEDFYGESTQEVEMTDSGEFFVRVLNPDKANYRLDVAFE